MHSSRMLIMSCLNSFKEKLSGDYKTLLKAHGFQIYNHPKLPKSTHPIKFLQRCQPKTENQFSNHRNPMEIPWKPKKTHTPHHPGATWKLCAATEVLPQESTLEPVWKSAELGLVVPAPPALEEGPGKFHEIQHELGTLPLMCHITYL